MCMLSLVVFAMPMTQADTAALDVHATKLVLWLSQGATADSHAYIR